MKKKNVKAVAISVILMFMFPGIIFAGGMFGPPQTISKKEGGLNTGIGYLRHEDKFENGGTYVVKQNQVYTQAGYGAGDLWEIYGRFGMSDIEIGSFEDNMKNFFGTLGGKIYYPYSQAFGIGVFVQGTYFFSDFTGLVPGTATEIKIRDMWDANFGIGIQATLPCGTRLYAGPFVYYSEAEVSHPASESTISNRTAAGGFAGIDMPLGKGFRLNLETQFSDRFSAGAAVTFTYF